MKLVYPHYAVELELTESFPAVLVVENPEMFQRLLGDFWNQLEGGEGDWILSHQGKNVLISKAAVGIYNPFMLDCNDKRILNKVYAELTDIAINNYPVEMAELNEKIVNIIDGFLQNVPYHLESQVDLDIGGLLKLYGIKFEMNQESLLERIMDYIRAMREVCHVEVFVFVNLKQYLSTGEIGHLYEFSAYEKISLLLIEGSYKKSNFLEKIWIYDQDLCMIKIEN
ncbi:MAG: type II-A CRISPR-associated protein Csn2 [Lachnospiraceae bacterium]|nr:type II-A CRISPR-associated protein Csn2 [Lachnospiraceae bacterium]